MVRKNTTYGTRVALDFRDPIDRAKIHDLDHLINSDFEGVVACEAKDRGLDALGLYDFVQSVYREGLTKEDYSASAWVRRITGVPPSQSVMASIETRASGYIREGKLTFLDTLRETYKIEFSDFIKGILLKKIFDETLS